MCICYVELNKEWILMRRIPCWSSGSRIKEETSCKNHQNFSSISEEQIINYLMMAKGKKWYLKQLSRRYVLLLSSNQRLGRGAVLEEQSLDSQSRRLFPHNMTDSLNRRSYSKIILSVDMCILSCSIWKVAFLIGILFEGK